MENKIHPLTINCNYFVRQIADAMRRHIESHRPQNKRDRHLVDTRNGCILITIVPRCILANSWLNHSNDYYVNIDHRPIPDLTPSVFPFKFHPEGSYLMKRPFADSEDCRLSNCFGLASMKTAYALEYHQRFHTRENDPEELWPENKLMKQDGWSKDAGADCVTVMYHGKPFFDICISVSGRIIHAEIEESDRACVKVGIAELEKFGKFDYSQGYTILNLPE